jgi:hypothetical protein
MRLLAPLALRSRQPRQRGARVVAAVTLGLLGSGLCLIDCGGTAFTTGGGSSGAGGSSAAGGVSAQGGTGGAITSSGGSSAGGISTGGGAGRGGASGQGGASGKGGGGSSGASGGASGGPPNGGAGGVGGSLAGGAGGAVGGAGGTNSGGTGGVIVTTACPVSPPTANSPPCAPGLSCTYGDDLRPACRTHVDCLDGAWVAQAAPACKPLIDCGSHDGGVPQVGKACTLVGDDCTLNEGAGNGLVYCRCDTCTASTCTAEWDCIGPPQSPCPKLLPNEGQPCDVNGESCSYGECGMPANDVANMQCIAHVWQQIAGGCVTAN